MQSTGENDYQHIQVAVVYGVAKVINEYRPKCSTVGSIGVKITDDILSWINMNMKRFDS